MSPTFLLAVFILLFGYFSLGTMAAWVKVLRLEAYDPIFLGLMRNFFAFLVALVFLAGCLGESPKTPGNTPVNELLKETTTSLVEENMMSEIVVMETSKAKG